MEEGVSGLSLPREDVGRELNRTYLRPGGRGGDRAGKGAASCIPRSRESATSHQTESPE